MSPLRAVLFDAGGTLFIERRSRAEIYADVARRHAGKHFAIPTFARAIQEVHAQLPQRIGTDFRYTRSWFERFIVEVFARAGVHDPKPEVARELFATFADPATFRVFDDVVPTLERLRARGRKLAVVSNWSPGLSDLLAGLHLREHFDVIVSSGQEQVEKPAAEIFALALARLRVLPAESLHVGDHPEKDVLGARAAGIAARLLDRSGEDLRAWTSLAPLGDLETLDSAR